MPKKIVVIPDSFKGTLSSSRNCSVSEEEIKLAFPECTVKCVPVADGGEGSVDAFLYALGGEKLDITVSGPFFDDVNAFYGRLPDGTAVIEMAACAGLPLAGERKNPEKTTTFGLGQMIEDAVKRGSKRIIAGLGGSCTNDAGCGMAAALGYRFYGKEGVFIPTGGTLTNVLRIEKPDESPLKGSEIVSMCDINNPLYGERGAAYVFAPQKGADGSAVIRLDKGLRHISDIIKRDLGIDVGSLPGAGAAGGLGAGMAAFAGAELKMGIETVLDTVAFDGMLEGADYVFTGEGRLDSQSLMGKAVIGVARRAKKKNVPVIAVVGGCDVAPDLLYGEGITAVFTINRLPLPLSESAGDTEKNFRFTMRNIMNLIKTQKRM